MSHPHRIVVAVALGCAIGCGDEDLALVTDRFALGEGRYHLEVRAHESSIVLQRDGARVISLDQGGFQLGIVAELGATRRWDPWTVEQQGGAGVEFRSPIRWTATHSPIDGEAAVDLDYGNGVQARLAIIIVSDARFSLTLRPSSPASGPFVALARIRVRTSGDPGEGFYGLGEQLDSVDNRGKLRPMQLEDDRDVESGSNEAHAPVPMLIGTDGWAMFVGTNRAGTFDVARKDPSIVEATFDITPLDSPTRDPTVPARTDPLRVDLFAADAPLDLFREYYAASGPPRPPPPWALGPWLWRSTSKDQAEVEDDAAKIRALDLATTGLWIERPYARAVNTFDFDPARFPDPQGMIDRLHGLGFRLALWSAPYLEPGATPMVNEATTSGFFPTADGPFSNPWSAPIDFTSPLASAFWRALVQQYTLKGIDGFRLDYGEDVVVSHAGARNEWQFSDGSDERTMHYRYSGLYHRVYSDAATGRDPALPSPANPDLPFLLVHGAHWGEQTLGVIVAPDRTDATFTRYKEHFTDSAGVDVVGIGGLPTSVIRGLSLASSGFPFFAADVGGSRHGPPDKELFVRSAEQAALSTVMTVGDGSGPPPWVSAPEQGRDAEALDIYRTYARLHARLFPYAWSSIQDLLKSGRPVVRPLGLAFPELGRHPDDTYMFGDELLVAPVLARGQTRRRIVVPRGIWYDFWDATALDPDAHHEVEVDAPLGKLPLLVREGAIIPMLGDRIDSLATATAPQITSFGGDVGPLWALVVPGRPRRTALWDGARVERQTDGTFEVADGTVFNRGFVLEVMATREPAEVLRGETLVPRAASLDALGAAPAGWIWSAGTRRGTLYVKVPAGPARIVVR